MDNKAAIHKPCTARTENMTRISGGYFCAQCNTPVRDLTSLSDEQLQNWLRETAGKKACGIYRDDQVKVPVLQRFLFPFRYAAVSLLALFAVKKMQAQTQPAVMNATDSSKTLSLHGDTIIHAISGKALSGEKGIGFVQVQVWLNDTMLVASGLTKADGSFELNVPYVAGSRYDVTADSHDYYAQETYQYDPEIATYEFTMVKRGKRHGRRTMGSKF